MKLRALTLVVSTVVCGCFNFDEQLDAGCARGAKWVECESPDAGDVDSGITCSAPVELSSGCIGQGAWCWENPGPLGVMELNAIWGRDDSDVYVSGGGGAFVHWNGSQWQQVKSFVPDQQDVGEPTVRIIECRADGFLLAGDRMAIYRQRESSWQKLHDVHDRRSASTLGDVTALLRGGTSNVDLVDSTDFVVKREQSSVGTFVGPVLLLDDGPLLAFWKLSGAGFQKFDGAVSELRLDGGVLLGGPTTFAKRRGQWVMLFADGRAVELQADGAWLETSPLHAEVQVEAHVFHELSDGGTDWWATGQGTSALYLRNGMSMVIEKGVRHEWGRANWMSPAGRYWAVGGCGRVVRAQGSSQTDVEELGSAPDSELRDVVASDDRVVAVGERGVRWVRTGGTWVRTKEGDNTLRAVAMRGDEYCIIDNLGELACWANGTRRVEHQFVALQPDGGSGPAAGAVLGSAGVAYAADGRLRAGIGGVVGFELTDGGWFETSVPDARRITSNLEASGDAVWVVFNETLLGARLNNGLVALVKEDGSATPCAIPSGFTGNGVYGLAVTASGALVVGDGWLGTCAETGVFTSIPVPETTLFVDVYEDVNRGTWLLALDGRMYYRAQGATVFTRDRTPASWSATSNENAHRITGNSTRLFVGVGRGGVMSRPLP